MLNEIVTSLRVFELLQRNGRFPMCTARLFSCLLISPIIEEGHGENIYIKKELRK